LQLKRICAGFAALTVMLAPLASSSASESHRSRGQETFYTPKQLDKNIAKFKRADYTNRYTVHSYAANSTPPVGKKRLWPALDDTQSATESGGAYFKKYKLRGLSPHAEFWTGAGSDDVASGLKFPAGDCRNDDPRRTEITNAQVKYFLNQFEKNMYPKETKAFSHPPLRAGNPKKAQLRFLLKPLFHLKLARDYWAGSGKRIVILVDNVRDDNYYDTDNANTLSRIGGFYSRFFSELLDRHIMSIDSFDWLGKTTETPPHTPSTDPCLNYAAAPFQYEGTFAHEFQHLMESYADPDGESTWVDEGMADWAQTLTGYVRPWEPNDSVFGDSHIQCYLGWLEQVTEFNPIAADNCGPEQSLNLWGDQVDNEIEILADYGAAYSMMEFLVDRYGADSMTFLHNELSDGFDALAALLTREGSSDTAQEVIHDWLLMIAVDKWLDDGATLHGSTKDLEVTTLNASIDWNNDDAYSSPGAPPNGADWLLARDANGAAVPASGINKIDFDGADVLPPHALEWVVDSTGHDGDPALFSGSGDNFDRAMIDSVAVPAGSPKLTFDTKYNTEQLYDYAFVQVSTNGGDTWTSLANADTITDTATGPPISDNLPGLNGNSGGGGEATWVNEEFDLSPYAGQTVLLSFRYMSDGGVSNPGWWVDNVKINDTVISDGNDIGDWESRTQVNPIEVAGFTVQIVAWKTDGSEVWVGRLPVGSGNAGSLQGQALRDIIGDVAENVGIIVTYDEPTESVTEYAPYTLNVNNVKQPGGGQ
jgi:hypothetical protein